MSDIMFKLNPKEIADLLEINKSILFKIKVKRKTCIYNIMKTTNRDYYLSGKDEKDLTLTNKEELSTAEEKIEGYYQDLVPLTNGFIYHNEIKRILQGKNTGYYINPLVVYKYYKSRGNRLTLVKLFILVSQNNTKFTKDDVSPLAVSENLLGNFATTTEIDAKIINILTNYLATIEIEYKRQATNAIDIKSINRVNKELIATLEKYLTENNIYIEDGSFLGNYKSSTTLKKQL